MRLRVTHRKEAGSRHLGHAPTRSVISDRQTCREMEEKKNRQPLRQSIISARSSREGKKAVKTSKERSRLSENSYAGQRSLDLERKGSSTGVSPDLDI